VWKDTSLEALAISAATWEDYPLSRETRGSTEHERTYYTTRTLNDADMETRRSFAVPGNKYPDGEPDDDWTVEQLIHWSLAGYQERANGRLAAHVASYREQCESECDQVMELHREAVRLSKAKSSSGDGPEDGNSAVAAAEDENVANGAAKPSAASSSRSGPSHGSVEVQVTEGNHAGSKFLLIPRPGAPCLVGRSKGKKFIKNGISLNKDQEVSTTHGKFLVDVEEDGDLAFYFVDVGSTNGTQYKGDKLEANRQVRLHDGMELTLGNSVCRIILA